MGILDEIIGYLGEPFFRIPVISFCETNCIIFEPSTEDSDEYKLCYVRFQELVNCLLEGLREDLGQDHNDIVVAVQKMSTDKNLGGFFEKHFEPILAVEDYKFFVKMMTKKNLELQEEALVILLKKTGAVPDIYKKQASDKAADETFVAVASKAEEDKGKQSAEEKKQAEDFARYESARLEEQKRQEEQKMHQRLSALTVEDKLPPLPAVQPPPQKTSHPPAPAPAPAPVKAPAAAAPGKATTPASAPAPAAAAAKPVSNADAAASWLASAKQDAGNQGGLQSYMATTKLSPEELKKRQEFLKAQRDQLIAMKKKEREKQLLTAEKAAPARPKSARAARSSLARAPVAEEGKSVSAEDQKQLEMRKAIAARLRQELVGKKS